MGIWEWLLHELNDSVRSGDGIRMMTLYIHKADFNIISAAHTIPKQLMYIELSRLQMKATASRSKRSNLKKLINKHEH